ncbi:MAG: TldD/PmbA family protein [Thermotogota bacterium]
MNVTFSNFIESKESLVKKLVQKLSTDYDYVSVLCSDTENKSYDVSEKSTNISNSMWEERGFVVRVYNNNLYTEYSFNTLKEEDLEQLIREIKDEVENTPELLKKQVKISDYPLITEEKIEDEFYGEIVSHPKDISSQEIINRLNRIKEKGMILSKKLIDLRVRFEWAHVSKMFISNKKSLKQSYVWSQGYIIPIMKSEENIKYTFKAFSGLKGTELITEMLENISESVSHTEEILDTKRVNPGEYDIICTPDIAGLIAHEAFGHGVEMDMFVKERAKAVEYIDKPVASQIVNMHDGATSANHVSSYLFDDEGIMGKDTKIIEDGILKRGISDTLSALRLGETPTGNGKRQSYKRKAYSRMTNTFFSEGKDDLEDMIKSIEHGYLLLDEMSGMEDPKNWGIQCMVLSAREIKDGKLTDNFFSPIVLTGYVPDVLKNISMISKNIELTGSGACGKGYKEFVKVSAGGPYIKTKARLG